MTVIAMPVPARTLPEECEHLFTAYPPEVLTGATWPARSMLLRDAGGARYYVLIQDTDDGQCCLYPWRSDDPSARIAASGGGDCDVPAEAAAVIRAGVPIPQGGSLFGWVRNGAVTAIMPVYVESTAFRPQPSFAVLPHERHRTPGLWPPFVWTPVISPEWWAAYRSGQLVSLGPVIAGTRGNVHWIEWPDRPETGHCTVSTDVSDPAGRYTLPAGRYADRRDVETGMRGIPSQDDERRGWDVTDLGTCF